MIVETIAGFRLSPQQEHLWSLQRESLSQPYRVQCAVSITGPLDRGRLRAAVAGTVARHPILRTAFRYVPGIATPLQVVVDPEVSWEPHRDLFGHEPEARRAAEEEVFAALLARPFDLERGAFLRAALLTAGPDQHLLILSASALCADAVGMDNLVLEIAASYEMGDGSLEEPTDYAVFSEWLNDLLETDEARVGREYWQAQDCSPAAPASLPFERSAEDASELRPREERVELATGPGTRAARGASPEATFLAAWQVLLWRLIGQPDVVVGSLADGRSDEDLQRALGPFARHLPVVASLDRSLRFGEVVARAEERLRENVEWQECFHAEALGGLPFLPFGFELEPEPLRCRAADLELAIVRRYACVDRFTVKLFVAPRDGELAARFLYDAARFEPAAIRRLAGQLSALVESAAAGPGRRIDELEILSREELQTLLLDLNRTETPWAGPQCLHQLVEEQAARTPQAVAVELEDDRLTYAQLNARANQLARRLRRLGVGPESRVGVLLERSFEMVVALLATLKAGGCYVPLDPAHPRERLALLADDAGPQVILTAGGLAEELASAARTSHIVRLDGIADALASEDDTDFDSGVTPDHLAYILYTSGSTGRPKGVMIAHRSICNRILWMRQAFPFSAADAVLQKTSFSFDASVWELFLPLMIGARLVLARPGGHQDTAYMVDAVRGHGVTVLQLVPSVLRVVLDEPALEESCRGLRLLFCGGEALPTELRDRVFQRLGVELHNLYGPTEVSIDATSWTCRREVQESPEDNAIVPIGRPISNMQVFLLNSGLQPVPVGAAGELHAGGVGLARGYLDRPDLTAERFIPAALSGVPGARLYKTGDLARQRQDGTIEYLGRIDHQVKIRGFRIELGEIEMTLARHPAVREAAVVVQELAGGPRLVAYAVPAKQSPLAVTESLYRLPNGLEVHHLNRGETDWLYSEIFEDKAYGRHGITLADGDCVIDAGANIGLFTIFVGTSFPNATIYAFEPGPPTFEKLSRNVELYGLRARLFQCALSDRSGEAVFTFYPQVSASSGLYPDAEEDERVTRAYLGNQDVQLGGYTDELMAGRFEGRQYICPLLTLSDVLREQDIERVDLLKLDVEKSELDVLAGLRDEDWPKIRQIVIEVHDLGGRVSRIRELLEGRGFDVAVEEADALKGSGLYNVYARHAQAPERVSPAPPAERAAMPAAEVLSVAGLRRYLDHQLPDYMVPAAFVLLDALPRTASGKVDRQALPAPAEEQGGPGEGVASPRTPIEEVVAAVCAEVLGLERLGLYDNFFDLGGHSLLATRAIGRLRRAFQLEIPLRSFFDAPRVADLAARIEEMLRERSAAMPPIEPLPRDGRPFALSFAQQRLWFFDRLMPGSAVYNVPAVVRLSGTLHLSALQRSLDALIERHESLRTTFREVDGQPVQWIGPPWSLSLQVHDLSSLQEAGQEGELRRLVQEELERPFDLERGPLLRATVVRLSAHEHLLIAAMHHIVADGWSMGVLIREVAALYEASAADKAAHLPELPVQYADFAEWQRRWLDGEALERHLAYWTRQLGTQHPVLELPTDRPRTAVQTFAGAKRRVQLSPALVAELRGLSRRQGSTVFMTLLAAFELLLHRSSGQQEILLGTNVAARERSEIEGLIGFFLNVLVLRADLSGNPSFNELLERVREVTLGAYTHQDLPFDKLVEALRPGRDRGRQPFFQVKVDYQNVPVEILTLPGLVLTPFELDEGPVHSEMTLSIFDSGPDLQLTFEYNRDLWNSDTIARMADSFVVLLELVVQQPGSDLQTLIAALDEAERHLTLAQGREVKDTHRRGLKDIRRKAITGTHLKKEVTA